jgi:septum formation protein
LLRSLGLTVEVAPSGYDEPPTPGLRPAQLARNHARKKLKVVLGRYGHAHDVPVVAADTVVDLDGAALGKPRDPAEAVEMLKRLSGRQHFVHSAFVLAVPGEPVTEDCVTTRVRFYPLERNEIEEYVATGEALDKAGAYGIQGRAAALVEGIDGDFYTVMGLPLGRFVRALRRLGFALPKTNSTAG